MNFKAINFYFEPGLVLQIRVSRKEELKLVRKFCRYCREKRRSISYMARHILREKYGDLSYKELLERLNQQAIKEDTSMSKKIMDFIEEVLLEEKKEEVKG